MTAPLLLRTNRILHISIVFAATVFLLIYSPKIGLAYNDRGNYTLDSPRMLLSSPLKGV